MHVFAGIALGLLIVNGLRVTIGIPPVSYWFRSRRCPVCEGVGFVKFHSHTGESADVPVELIRQAKGEDRG